MPNWSTQQAEAALRRAGVANSLAAACGEKCDKPAKYRNRKVTLDGTTFASSAEAKAYVQLKAMEASGEIAGLELQPKFVLQEAFRDARGKSHRKLEYWGDFRFMRDGIEVCVDVKGHATEAFKIKWKLAIKGYPNIKFELWKRGKQQ